jgi:hypothetical protein
MTIQPGMIGVNTADDGGELILCIEALESEARVRPLVGGKEYTIPAADFWPLISKLNGVQ